MDLADPETRPSPEPADPPDWQSITRDVKCPLCGYNLRGLIEPGCPECGYQFEWERILHPERDIHPYLFEHHPRRNFRSFFETLFRSPLSASGFWHTLAPAHRVRVGRLVLYWLVYSILALAPAMAPMLWIAWHFHPSPYFYLLPLRSRAIAIASEVGYGAIVTAAILLSLFPWFNFLALLIFQQSMRRSRVRAVHVLRVVIYSGDTAVWFSMGACAVFVISDSPDFFEHFGHPFRDLFVARWPMLTLVACAFLAMVLVNSFRLWVAYRVYLRFQRALSFVVASQIIVILITVAVLAWTSEHLR